MWNKMETPQLPWLNKVLEGYGKIRLLDTLNASNAIKSSTQLSHQMAQAAIHNKFPDPVSPIPNPPLTPIPMPNSDNITILGDINLSSPPQFLPPSPQSLSPNNNNNNISSTSSPPVAHNQSKLLRFAPIALSLLLGGGLTYAAPKALSLLRTYFTPTPATTPEPEPPRDYRLTPFTPTP